MSVWRRFRLGLDGFTFVKEPEYYAAHVVTGAVRATGLFGALLAHMPTVVDVAVDDRHSQRSWAGEQIPLAGVQDAVSRLKGRLSSAGGVEIAVYTKDDQITLNPQVEIFVYARSDRWREVLVRQGLVQRKVVATRSWKIGRREFEPVPDLTTDLEAAAAGLGLRSV